MIRNPDRLARLEHGYERAALADLTFKEALERFTALWTLARMLNPELGEGWRADLESDLAVARALNGLPPSA